MISDRLAAAIRRVLNLGSFDFQDDTKAFQVPGWDSLRHVEVLTEVEREFGIRFRALEVLKLKSVGDLQALVDQKSRRTDPS